MDNTHEEEDASVLISQNSTLLFIVRHYRSSCLLTSHACFGYLDRPNYSSKHHRCLLFDSGLVFLFGPSTFQNHTPLPTQCITSAQLQYNYSAISGCDWSPLANLLAISQMSV